MSSAPKRTQRRALTLIRSFANAVKSRFSSDKPQPRQLRRAQIPVFKHAHFIRRLPVELLAYVFVLSSEDDVMLPVRVSHVCKKWREIALRTPTLWRRITLSPEINMWKERIRRAGACTLDVQLVPSATTRWPNSARHYLDPVTVQWYMQPAISLIRRWRSLEIVFADYSPYLWNAALSGCCSRSQRAQALALVDLTLAYRANDDTKEFCLFSGVAPRLRNVTLDGIRLTWLPSLFGNLTYLDYTHHGFSVEHQAVHDVISMLEVSNRLVELKICFPPKRRPATPTRSHPVTRRALLASLQHLHLRVEGCDIPFELAHLMTLVHTPCLRSLRLIDVDRRHLSFPSLKSFFFVYAISRSLRVLRVEHGCEGSAHARPGA
ncbi:putative F-box-like [Lyophyllum shimeji]|uniref:F-box-like n=1 Tax=Lyophyllum shimeji TaxID=47721 RepID=A0A9P3UKL3_LYOSH|nr:putative F-box-like [Lyophyllum shimeji]